MATYDNKHWLLSNIRNSFISTDDTRMCEIVMAGENFPKQLYNKALDAKNKAKEQSQCKYHSGSESTLVETEHFEVVTEFDPYPDMEDNDDDLDLIGSYIRYEDFGPIRQRSNTAQWLDKKEQAMKKAAKIKVIKWEDPPAQLTEEERTQIFPKKEMTSIINIDKSKKKSLLTDQLEKCPHLPHRQYLEFAKYDGTAQLGLPTKTFRIFMNFLPEEHQNYPITICVVANAKIQDLIGFTCYKYSIEHPEIVLGSVHSYGLCIAEDDGEVDWAFPCLDANEPCSKFGFTCLGLIDLKAKNGPTCMPGSLPEENVLFPTFCNKLGESSFPISRNMSRHNTGGSGTSEAALKVFYGFDHDNTSRVVDRKNTINKTHSKTETDHDIDKINSHILASEAPHYKSYNVQMLHKPLAKTNVQLGVSLERIDIEPLPSNSNKFWAKTKHVSYTMDCVVWCQLVEAKTNKTQFRIIYAPIQAHTDLTCTGTTNFLHPTSYKHHDFECDHETAKEIFEKINRILDLRNSACRRDYQAFKDRKVLQSRRSFNVKQMS